MADTATVLVFTFAGLPSLLLSSSVATSTPRATAAAAADGPLMTGGVITATLLLPGGVFSIDLGGTGDALPALCATRSVAVAAAGGTTFFTSGTNGAILAAASPSSSSIGLGTAIVTSGGLS